jgi:glycosyltransferase involved in cell wall biosynthesis
MSAAQSRALRKGDRKTNEQFRILHLASSERWTGVADPVTSLARLQQELGHDVWLSCVPGRSFERKAREQNVRVVNHLYLNRRLHPAHLIHDLRALRRFVIENGISVVHAHLLNDHWLAALALRRLPHQCLRVRTMHRVELPRRDPLHRWLFLRQTDLVIALCETGRQMIEHALPDLSDRIAVAWGGVDAERFRPELNGSAIRAQLNIPEEAPVAGLVARLRADRGIHWLLRTIPAILQEVPDAHFVVVGRGELKKPLRSLIKRLPFGNRIRMAGYRSADLPQAYAAFDVSLFLGIGAEGTCRAILEAMASGKPVVGVNRGAIPEIITRETGFVVEDKDVAGLSGAVVKLLKDRGVARRMGENARTAVLTRFTQRRRAEDTLRAYQTAWRRKISAGSR